MRDEKLDLIRGVAMVTIAINHLGAMVKELGYDGARFPTLTGFGYSSAAELFFLLSGYMVGFIYLKKNNYSERLRSRAWQLYKYNAYAFIASLLAAFILPDIKEVVSAQFTFDNPVLGVSMFLFLVQHPDLLGVLQLYILLMVVAPYFVLLYFRSPIVTIAISIIFYTLAQLFPEFNLPGGSPEGDWRWNFNPFAWQLLFFLGIVAGDKRIHFAITELFSESRLATAAAIATFSLIAVYHRLSLLGYVPSLPADKSIVSPVCVIHAVITVLFLFSLLTVLEPFYRDSTLAKVVERIGRSTLLCYTLSIPLTYIVAGLWLKMDGGMLAYLLGVVAILVTIYCAAVMNETRRLS